MATFRPNAGMTELGKKPHKSPFTPTRQVDRCIEHETVIYTCSECAWKFVVKAGEYSEPMRGFIEHHCADYPAQHSLDS